MLSSVRLVSLVFRFWVNIEDVRDGFFSVWSTFVCCCPFDVSFGDELFDDEFELFCEIGERDELPDDEDDTSRPLLFITAVDIP